MFSRFVLSISLALLFALVFAFPAWGGGWAVITLDELPTGVVAGEPLSIGFMMLQHGKTPMTGLDPTVTARHSSGEKFVVLAEPDGEPGHYTAALTFPKEGRWEWSIQAFTMDQSLPALSVAAPSLAVQPLPKTAPEPARVAWLALLRASSVGIALIGLLIAWQRKSRWAAALAGLFLLTAIASFIPAANAQKVEAQSKAAAAVSVEPSVSQVELGRQLFVAKGCITCHLNRKVPDSSEYLTVQAGPDLSKFSASPEVLFVRLKDPAAAKSDTKMPNLGLKQAEIEALIAFINSK